MMYAELRSFLPRTSRGFTLPAPYLLVLKPVETATCCPSNSQRPGTPLHHVPAFLRQLHSHRNLRPTSHLVPASSASSLQHGMFAPLGMTDGSTCFLQRPPQIHSSTGLHCCSGILPLQSRVPTKHYTLSTTTRPISATFQ